MYFVTLYDETTDHIPMSHEPVDKIGLKTLLARFLGFSEVERINVMQSLALSGSATFSGRMEDGHFYTLTVDGSKAGV